jgi:uncharacterized membrane protein
MRTARELVQDAAHTEGEGNMLLMVIGLALFFLVHLLPTSPDIRRSVVERYGEGPYKLAFSLVSAAGLALVVYGYAKLGHTPGKNPEIWLPPNWLRHVTMLLMPIAFVLLAAAYIPSRIRTAARHPMLAAIKIWAFAHLLVNGDLASIVLFGSFLAYAVYDRISVKKRVALGPLGAAQGGLAGDVAAVAVGLAVYVVFLLWGHAALVGVPLVPGWT